LAIWIGLLSVWTIHSFRGPSAQPQFIPCFSPCLRSEGSAEHKERCRRQKTLQRRRDAALTPHRILSAERTSAASIGARER
jgi:hypothetical protein